MRQVFAALLFALIVARAGAEDGVVTAPNGSSQELDIVGVDDRGVLSYQDGKAVMKLKPTDYKFARLKKTPAAVAAAEKSLDSGDFAGAAAAFNAAGKQYGKLGYEIQCVAGEGYALFKAGKTDEGVKVLEALKNPKLRAASEFEKESYGEGLQYLCEILISQGKNQEVDALVAEYFPKSAKKPIMLVMGEGQSLENQGKKKEAVVAYMRASLLYAGKGKTRAKAIFKVASLLKEMKDRRWEDWKKMLDEEFPGNPYSKEL